jgi:hypothetical protein
MEEEKVEYVGPMGAGLCFGHPPIVERDRRPVDDGRSVVADGGQFSRAQGMLLLLPDEPAVPILPFRLSPKLVRPFV